MRFLIIGNSVWFHDCGDSDMRRMPNGEVAHRIDMSRQEMMRIGQMLIEEGETIIDGEI